MGNLSVDVTEDSFAQIFGSIGPLEGCKLIKEEKVRYYLLLLKRLFKALAGDL